MNQRNRLSERSKDLIYAWFILFAILVWLAGFVLTAFYGNYIIFIFSNALSIIISLIIPLYTCKIINYIIINNTKRIIRIDLNDFETDPIYRKDYFKALKELNEMFPGGGL